MKTISLCMIVCNEEKMLANTLKSVQSIVNEIIIVDTGSIDKTKDIANQFGAKVIDYIWKDDFSNARNCSLENAKSDWVLVLDADETISQSDHEALLSLVNVDEVDAYSLVQRTYGNNLKHAEYVSRNTDDYVESKPYAGWIPSGLVRLFRNDSAYRFRYRIHEVIEPSIEDKGGNIRDCTIPIHHFTYEKSSDFVSEKHERYLAYGLKQINDTPNNPKPYLEVALVYLKNKEFSRAEEILLKGLVIAPTNVDLYDTLASLYLDSNRATDAEGVIQKGLSLRRDDVVLLNKLASTYMARRAFDDAEKLLKRAKKLSPQYLMIHNNLGLLYAISNQPKKAVNSFKDSLKLSPANLYALTNIGMLYVNLGQFKKASPFLEKAVDVGPEDVRALFHLALVYDALKKKDKAIQLLIRAKELQPLDPVIEQKLNNIKQ